jgi:hypothetical protein
VARARRSFEPESATDEPSLQCSDDECLRKLAALIKSRDRNALSIVAKLIGRLAVPIE